MSLEEKIEVEQETVEATFTLLINNLATTARLHLGLIPDPVTGKTNSDLMLAKHLIDTIDMLETKTQGNLEAPETNFLQNSLYSLKMDYVKVSEKNIKSDISEETSQEDKAEEEV